jgi:nicotinamide mononucleotide transporter
MSHNFKLRQPWYKYILFFWDWSVFEKCLLSLNTLAAIAILIWQIIQPDTGATWYSITISFIAALTNIICNILIAKRKISNYFWAMIAVATTGGVAFISQLTGVWMLNWVFLSIGNMLGFILWFRNSNDKITVHAKKLPYWLDLIALCVIAGLIVLLSWTFQQTNFQIFWYGSANTYSQTYQYVLDASILVMSVSAMVMTVFRLREQWILWLVANIACIVLYASMETTLGIQMIVMYACLEINATYGLIMWFKENKKI